MPKWRGRSGQRYRGLAAGVVAALFVWLMGGCDSPRHGLLVHGSTALPDSPIPAHDTATTIGRLVAAWEPMAGETELVRPSDGWSGSFDSDPDSRLYEVARLPPVAADDVTFAGMMKDQADGIRLDYIEFYSLKSMTWLTAGIGAGALMANTGFDEHAMRDTYVENIVFAPSDELYELFHKPKFLGDGLYTIPAFALAALAEPVIDELPLGPPTAEWGQRSLRTILVGGPPLLGLQWLTGGSRPTENRSRSHWEPLQDNNGVSGHSFMGAIPFLSAAKMSDNIWMKSGLYTASALPALSRVNDDDHYFSQSFLGWWLAYLAASAVDRSHQSAVHARWSVVPHDGGVGLMLDY